MSPVSLEQLAYLEVMIPAFTQEWNNNTPGAAWTGRTWLLPGGGAGVRACGWGGSGGDQNKPKQYNNKPIPK